MTFVALRSLLYVGGLIALWSSLGARARRFDVPPPEWLRTGGAIAGLPILLAGAVLFLVCQVQFIAQGRGTLAHFDAPRRFVARGIYRFVRNPMYEAVLLMVAGSGLMLHSSGMLMLCLAAFIIFHVVVILIEEPSLRRKFGREYDAYTASVRRWLPGRL
jgi:protein-S-isoprenylcysteine O-methyltransferase Ste14